MVAIGVVFLTMTIYYARQTNSDVNRVASIYFDNMNSDSTSKVRELETNLNNDGSLFVESINSI